MSEWLKANKIKLAALTLLVSNLLVWGFVFSLPDGKLHLKFYDVGQGDAIFLETATGYKILIDGGPSNQVVDYLGKDLPFYSKKLDLLISTHPESDHLTGLLEVVKRYKIKTLWINGGQMDSRVFKSWSALLKEKKLQQVVVYQGDKLVFPDKTQIEVLWPKKDFASSSVNSHAIVVQLSYGQFDAVLTGDADEKVQPYTSSTSHVEVLKVPHHGSKTALNETYLSTLSPEVSIISVGAKNPYGHPSAEAINLLKKTSSKIYRTDKNGTIEVVSNGQSWQVKSRF